RLPADLPGHAEPVARRLFGVDAPFESLDEAAQALRAMEHHPQRLTRRTRVAQLAFGSSAPVLLATLFGLALLIIAPFLEEARGCTVCASDLQRGAVVVSEGDGAEQTRPLADEQREARELLIAHWWQSGRKLRANVNSDAALEVLIRRVAEQHPEVSSNEV